MKWVVSQFKLVVITKNILKIEKKTHCRFSSIKKRVNKNRLFSLILVIVGGENINIYAFFSFVK